MKWDIPKENPRVVHYYRVYYYSQGNSTHKSEVTTLDNNPNIVVYSLAPNTTYIFKVVAMCQHGSLNESNESDPITTGIGICSKPGAPMASNITQHTINLIWDDPKISPELNQCYFVHYCCLHGTKYGPWRIITNNNAIPGIMIDQLQPSTNYVFKVVAQCEYGKIESDESNRITTEQVVCSKPGKPYPSHISHNRIKLNWEKPATNAHMVQHYEIHGQSHNEQLMSIKLETKDSSTNITIYSLLPTTTYTFNVIAKCNSGHSEASEESEPIITKAQCSSSPGKPKAIETTYCSIRIRWDPPIENKDLVKYYIINGYIRNKHAGVPKIQKHSVDSIPEILIDNLTPSSSYTFNVAAQCIDAISEGSAESDPITTSDSMDPPGKPGALEVSSTAILLEWKKPQYNICAVKQYSIAIAEYSNFKQNDLTFNWTTIPGEVTKHRALNLTPNTTYQFKVIAESSDGQSTSGPLSDPITTKQGVSSAPGPPYEIDATENSITLQWEEPKQNMEAVIKYRIGFCIQTNQSANWCWKTTKNKPETKIDHLQPNNTYTFKVIAQCECGDSKESGNSIPIRTKQTVCDRPGKPVVATVNNSSILLKWEAPKFGRELIKRYCIRINRQPIKEITFDPTTEYLVRNLKPGTDYMFFVTAECLSGDYSEESERSDIIVTEKEACGQPGKPKATEVTMDSITLTWEKPVECAFLISRYRILTNGL